MPAKREALIVGLGHIGASLAQGLSKRGWLVHGFDRNPKSLRYCRRKGWVKGTLSPAMRESGISVCIIAVPESQLNSAAVLRALTLVPRGTLVTDVCSSKGEGVIRLAKICRACELDFGWSHPLAGREGHGALSADAAIFKGALVLIDRDAKASVQGGLKKFWMAAGAGNVQSVTMLAHQTAMGHGSHLVHVLAFALTRVVSSKGKVSPSVLGATRVAQSDARAWSEILTSNRRQTVSAVDSLIEELETLRGLIRRADAQRLSMYLAKSRNMRLNMEKKRANR